MGPLYLCSVLKVSYLYPFLTYPLLLHQASNAAMNVHNDWRHAQGLPPLPSKFKRLPTQEEPCVQSSDQAIPQPAGADFLDPVLARLAVADDESNDSDSAEEDGCSIDDDAALADESLTNVEGRIEAQVRRRTSQCIFRSSGRVSVCLWMELRGSILITATYRRLPSPSLSGITTGWVANQPLA